MNHFKIRAAMSKLRPTKWRYQTSWPYRRFFYAMEVERAGRAYRVNLPTSERVA